ncbi:hypothetical protein [Providencia sp. PROV236]|uniref:hypothetical protein n=1 Tax=Providencia sp. PROV236 TaxID=2936798 RepID=UPI0034E26F7B
MEQQLSYLHDCKLKIKEHTLSHLRSSIEKIGEEMTSLTREISSTERMLSFKTIAVIEGQKVKLDIEFKLDEHYINGMRLSINERIKDINSYTLKFFSLNLIHDILSNDHNEELTKYTIRTYSRYYCCYPIKNSILIKSEPKFLIKPIYLPPKNEPLTEQILMFDIEVYAVNIEHARNIAYNHTSNVNAYLSILLDCGFEMVNSEFRLFTKKGENGILECYRYRTGFVDYELGLAVKDNHYGLKDLYDNEQIDTNNLGVMSVNFAGEKEDGRFECYSTSTIKISPNSIFLDEKFREHNIISPSGSKDRTASPNLSDELNFLTNQMIFPAEIRIFFKSLISLDIKKKDAFLACSRLYNLALTMAAYHPTAAQSYKVCAIEALAIGEGMKFSEFMIKYSKDGFDKELTDYFYSIRSKHFHAGQFHFNEYNIEFQREIAFTFNEQVTDIINFSKLIRIAIINWVKLNLINKP